MRRLTLAALLLACGPALAETMAIRGGEHADYTRLVVGIPDGAIWTLVPVPGGYELRMPPGAGYDLSRAFDKIPRTRLRALASRGEGRLALSVDCDCHIKTQALRGVGLVLDVTDGPGPLRPGPASVLAAGSGLPSLLAASTPGATLLAPPSEVPRPLASSPEEGPDAETVATMERIAASEEAILESFADAASQGFLDLAPAAALPESPEPHLSAPPEAQAHVPEPEPLSIPGPPVLLTEGVGPGVAFRTATDRPATSPRLGATGTICLPDETFDISAWAGSGEFEDELPPRLARISDERERLDPEALEDLARAYLAFGFGREARQALGLDGTSSRERDLLRLLAGLIDGESAPSEVLDDQAGCSGPVALWRALARGSIQSTDERERTAMTLALRALPDPVRALLAPRLAELFLKDGLPAEAQAIAALVDPEEQPTEAQVTQATILKETEGPEPALAELQELAETDPRMTPAGMLELIDLSIREGRPVLEDELELVRSLRFEYGGEDGRRLLLAEARALAAARRFEDALALLLQERRVRPGADLEDGLTQTVLALTTELDDGPFLELALGRLPADLPSPAAEAVAERLARLGFPEGEQRFRTPDLAAQPGPASPTILRATHSTPDEGEDQAPSRTLLPETAVSPATESPDLPPVLPTLLPPTVGSAMADTGDQIASIKVGVPPASGPEMPKPAPRGQEPLQALAGSPPAPILDPTSGPAGSEVLPVPSPPTAVAVVPAAGESVPPVLLGQAGFPTSVSDPSTSDPISLAQGRTLLEQAKAARERAEALLGASASP